MKSIPSTYTPAPIHPQVRVGHVHLKVADQERSLAFYRDVLGFEVTQRFGAQAVFLSSRCRRPRGETRPPIYATTPAATASLVVVAGQLKDRVALPLERHIRARKR